MLLARIASHREFAQPHLHRAGDVRDHLHVAAEVAAAALALEDLGVDLPRGHEVPPREILVEDALVGAEIHVGLAAVAEDEHLAVAVRIERARIDVEVALHLDGGDRESLVLDELGERAREDPLAEAAHHRSDHDHELGAAALVAGRRRRVPFRALLALAELGEEVAGFGREGGVGWIRVGHS